MTDSLRLAARFPHRVFTMSSIISSTHLDRSLDARLVLLLASVTGAAAASLYYNQPLLGELASAFDSSTAAAARIPTLTQLSYALGLLLFAPLGDRFDRRGIILIKLVVLSCGLLAAGCAQTLLQMCIASVGLGLAATVAQDCVPAAATLSADARRGRTVGMVMTGLLLGILASRVVSGVVASCSDGARCLLAPPA